MNKNFLKHSLSENLDAEDCKNLKDSSGAFSMTSPRTETDSFLPVILLMLAYSLVVTITSGDIGFEGDDWWIFSWPYWNSFPQSLFIYARESLRPLEGVYWITLFEIFGFNKVVFHFFSLSLLVCASTLMGACLLRAFPGKRLFAISAMFMAFFIPTVSCLTFVVTTDNSRLSMALFWGAVLAFQRWVERGTRWSDLPAPTLLYICAFLTYEAPSLLIFSIPFFVLPIYLRLSERISAFNFGLRLFTAIATGFCGALFIRFLLLSGGAVTHKHFLPPLELVWSYFALLPFYLIEPFISLELDWRALFIGLPMVGALAFILFLWERPESGKSSKPSFSDLENNKLYVLLLALVVVALGMAPYQLAGYGAVTPRIVETVLSKYGFLPDGNTAWFNFNWSSRVYSSASFGLAILFGLCIGFWKNPKPEKWAKTATVIIIGFLVFFHASLITDWKEAAQKRNSICESLVSEAPDVLPNTNLLLVNLEYYHKRAAVFRGWGGLKELVRMLYDSRDLGAFYVHPYAWNWPNKICQQGIARRDGFCTRGVRLDKPLPLESLVILNRFGDKMQLVEKLSCFDSIAPTGISWNEITTIHSNPDRIVGWSETVLTPQRLVKNAWSSGLITTLNLSHIKLGYRILNKWTYTVLSKDRGISRALK